MLLSCSCPILQKTSGGSLSFNNYFYIAKYMVARKLNLTLGLDVNTLNPCY